MKKSIISDMTKYSQPAFGLRDFLRGSISLEQSKQVLSARLSNRERDFLSLVQKGIHRDPKSPYLKLLGTPPPLRLAVNQDLLKRGKNAH